MLDGPARPVEELSRTGRARDPACLSILGQPIRAGPGRVGPFDTSTQLGQFVVKIKIIVIISERARAQKLHFNPCERLCPFSSFSFFFFFFLFGEENLDPHIYPLGHTCQHLLCTCIHIPITKLPLLILQNQTLHL